jgi:hypothetical protein
VAVEFANHAAQLGELAYGEVKKQKGRQGFPGDLRELKYPQGDSNNARQARGKCQRGNATARQTAQFSPDLRRVIDEWPDLPKHTRRAILALTDGAAGARENAYGGPGRDGQAEGE